MAGLQIGEPNVLARLPRPLSNSGRSWTSVVHGLSNGNLRKRQEICSAVDGDSVSILEVRGGRNLCSFSVPADSSFQCAPASFREKSEASSPERITYCATKRRNHAALQLFKRHGDEAKSPASSQHISLAEDQSSVCNIMLLQALGVVGVVHQNGSYQLFATDLSSVKGFGNLESPIQNARFVHVEIVSAKDAPTSILKSRPDIVASTSSTLSAFACGVIISRAEAGEGQQSVHYCIWRISMTAAGVIEARLILSHCLAATNHLTLRDHDAATFASKSTKLILRTTSKVIKYDLSSIVPRQILEFAPPSPDHISNIEISNHLILCANAGAIQIYNSSFRSLQSSIDLSKSSLKRKRGDSLSGPVSLIAYFPSLHRAVGTRRNYLVAIDIQSESSSDPAAEFQQSSLLLYNIGRGATSGSKHIRFSAQSRHISLGSVSTQQDMMEDWTALRNDLDMFASQNNGAAFETAFIEHIQSQSNTTSVQQVIIPEQKINYVLSKIFVVRSPTSAASENGMPLLSQRLFCPNLLRFLIKKGYMSAVKLAQAMPILNASIDFMFSSTNIINAFIDADHSLTGLHHYIMLTPRFEVDDLCRILRLVVNMALTNTGTDDSKKVQLNDQHDQNATLISRPQHRPHIDSSQLDLLLSSTLTRLAKMRHQSVSMAMGATLNRHDLVALIQFLRQKLYQGGYTRSFSSLTQSSAESNLTAQHQAALTLSDILVVLSSCVDAVGPLGLLNSGPENNITEKLIPELSSEIQRATDAIEEAVYLQGIVRETLRYSESLLGQHQSRTAIIGTEEQSQKAGTIRTLHSAAVANKTMSTTATLPISLQAETRIDKQKVRKGNGKSTERSKREMGMLQDRLRGPYSLERLVL